MNTFILIVIIAVPLLTVAGLFLFFGIKGHGGGFLRPKDWALDAWSKNVKLDDPPVAGSIWSFKFPNKDGVHTISKRITGGLTVGKQVSMTFEIIGKNPVFIAAGETPTVGFYIGAGRIYSNYLNRLPLKLGKQTLIVPLTPDRWSTVDGYPCNYDQAHINEFEKSVKLATTIGPCFGDTHGFAHGANLTANGGSAEFRMLAFVP